MAFSKEEYKERLARMRKLMADNDVDLLYVTSPEGMCYFTGYAATWYRANSVAVAALAIHVDHDEFVFYDSTAEFVVHQATTGTTDRHWLPDQDWTSNNLAAYVVKDLKKRGWARGRVGLEMKSPLPSAYVSNAFQAAFLAAGAQVVDGTSVIRRVRMKKSPQEVKYTEEAARICDIGHRAIAANVRPSVTQLELHGCALHAMMAAGGELPGINQGVVAGPLGSAHGFSTTRPIQPGDTFSVDLAGVVNRYHANICRTYVYGEPSKKMMQANKTSRDIIDLYCREAKVGVSKAHVKRLLREYSKEAGVADGAGWIRGYEMGIALPPDWVSNWTFNWGHDSDTDVFEEALASNFESIVFLDLNADGGFGPDSGIGGNIETVIYEKDGARSLSRLEIPIIIG